MLMKEVMEGDIWITMQGQFGQSVNQTETWI